MIREAHKSINLLSLSSPQRGLMKVKTLLVKVRVTEELFVKPSEFQPFD